MIRASCGAVVNIFGQPFIEPLNIANSIGVFSCSEEDHNLLPQEMCDRGPEKCLHHTKGAQPSADPNKPDGWF